MRLMKLIMSVQLVLGSVAPSHAAGVSMTSCDHERSRTSRTVLQQVTANTLVYLVASAVDQGPMCCL